MLLLVFALHLEAQPFIEALGLRKDLGAQPLDVFRNEEYVLTVTGIGKVKCAVRTSALLHHYGEKIHGAVNIGICGSGNASDLGSIFQVHQILDLSSSRRFYPDCLWRLGFPQARLSTSDTVVLEHHAGAKDIELVDMEASGFFEAAATWLAPHRLLCLKIVSDLLSTKDLSKELVLELMQKSLEKIVVCLQKFHLALLTEQDHFSQPEKEYLENLFLNLKLSVSQRQILLDDMRKFKALNGKDRELPNFSEEVSQELSTRTKIKKIFEMIREKLLVQST